MINRLRYLMTSVFPCLEREFDYASCKGALVLFTGCASPQRIRRIGPTRLVPRVLTVSALDRVFRVAEMAVRLAFEAGLQHAAREVAEQTARAGEFHPLRPGSINEPLEELGINHAHQTVIGPRSCFGRGIAHHLRPTP